MKKLTNITASQISQRGVQALADRPNATQQYGTGGLSATQLKLWFDKLSSFLAEKINAIHGALSADDAAEYIRIALDEYGVSDLQGLVTSITSGALAQHLLNVYSSANAEEMVPLQTVLFDFAKRISQNEEEIGDGYATFVPHVSENGDISWTNDKDLPNPETVNIKGPKPKKRVDYWTDEDVEEMVDAVISRFINAAEVPM